MNILISGGFGFIGSYLAGVLLRGGHQVGILARNVPPYFKALADRTEVFLSDITENISIKSSRHYDLFIHLAAANDIDSADTLAALKGTTLGTKNCLDFCRTINISQFVYYSTFQVYGEESLFVDENSPIRCRNDYAISHFFAEEYVRMYQRMGGPDYLILRPTNVYGSFLDTRIDRWSLVPSCFCREAFEQRTITLRSSGNQYRDFISLEDLTTITSMLCMDFGSFRNQVINVARGASLSIIEVAKITLQVYEEIFDGTCRLHVLSDKPAAGPERTVSTAKIGKLNYEYSQNHTIDQDIRRIFLSLKECI